MRAIRVYRGILVHPTSKEQWGEEGEEGLGRNKDKDKENHFGTIASRNGQI